MYAIDCKLLCAEHSGYQIHPSAFPLIGHILHISLSVVTYLLLIDCNPVRGAEPFMALDITHAILQIPKSFGKVNLQKVSEKILQIRAEVRREPYL